ncbi:MAG: tRNA (adenosine(37)-N6)-dimethylallyltransferase MiaA [Myxococcales bacterium]|nr:tRNA (adenosine(37)-N6)-dimethylallyltransferase MiaA [Myxococcales bacterium]
MVSSDLSTSLGCRIIVIVGPTAVGKSALAVWLANAISAEIISADSVQIYRYLNIGSSKITLDERQGVPHHLIDIVNPDEHFDSGRFARAADLAVSEIVSRGKIPIVVGGTGLWIRAFLHGLAESCDVPAEVKRSVDRRYREKGLHTLYEQLCLVDPILAARLPRTDTQRILRAIEVYEATGRRLSDLQGEHRFQQERYNCLRIGLRMDRAELYERINCRVIEMVDRGLKEEVAGILGRGYAPDVRALAAPGYRETVQFLLGNLDHATLVAQIQQSHRRYAKRQLTWFASEQAIRWYSPEQRSDILQDLRDFLGGELREPEARIK